MTHAFADRECPNCGKDRLCTPREARKVFDTSAWGSEAMLDDGDRVCSFCHAVRIDGMWRRMQSLSERAWRLSMASASKDKDDYMDALTVDDPPADRRPAARREERGVETNEDLAW